jgi:beta-N-acetylhexosaminidase
MPRDHTVKSGASDAEDGMVVIAASMRGAGAAISARCAAISDAGVTAGRGAAREVGVRMSRSREAWTVLRKRACATALAGVALATVVLSGCGGGTGLTAAPGVLGAAPANSSATATPAAALPVADALRELRLRATVDAYLAHMTLDEKLGQMVELEVDIGAGGPVYYPDMDNMVRGLHAGAIIVYIFDTKWPLSQLRDYLNSIQGNAQVPLLTMMDEEGGVVDRLEGWDGPRPSAQDLGASGNPQNAYLAAAKDAHDLRAIGINTDLAPVVDTRLIPNQVEWTRLYGDDPKTVDRYAGAFLQGLQKNGEIGTLKHWPGIGSIWQDPHLTLPTITRTRAQLEASEFQAFRGVLALDPGLIMVTHVVVSAIDPNLPATLSPLLVNGVLRKELGYAGVVVTDNLYMEGIRLHWALGEAAVLSVMAGDDLLATAWDSGSMTTITGALKQAIHDGRISVARIDQSVRRILTLKARYGLLPPITTRTPPPVPVAEAIGSGMAVADRARTVGVV